MSGTRRSDEPDDLIRAHMDQLTDPEWWKHLQLDFVVLYAWGDPRYLSIAKAIRSGGIFLIQNLDTSGFETPYADTQSWYVSLRDLIRGPQPCKKKARFVARGLRDLFPRIYEIKRLSMLAEADIIGCVSPPAYARVSGYMSALGRPDLVGNLRVIPHPVTDSMRYGGEAKRNRVVCVGRWTNDAVHQKDPDLTLQVLMRFLEDFPDWDAEIIGRNADRLKHRVAYAQTSIQERIQFTNFIEHDTLRNKYLESKILLCASRYESYHISSAEALCCGASVVTASHPLLASTAWFTSDNSGTLAKNRSVESLSQSLSMEAQAWEQGSRDPLMISKTWCPRVHGSSIASQIISLFRESQSL